MDMTRSLIPRALLALFVAGPASAWGPYSHVILNQLAVERLQETPGLELFQERKYRVLFARAGASADLVFSIKNGGKTDPAMNAVLHDPGFHAELYHRCKAADDKDCQAFALGLLGHQAADHAGNRADSASAANVFEWANDQDVFGAPVDAPERSAAAQLRTVTIGVNKILIDGLLKRHEVSFRRYQPYVHQRQLTEALQAYDGPNALPNDTEAERAEIADHVGSYSRRFFLAYTVLRGLGRSVHLNGRIRGPLEDVYGAEVDQLPTIRSSVDEIVAAVSRLVAGAPGPVRAASFAPEVLAAGCHDLTGSLEGLGEAVQEHEATRFSLFGAQDDPGDEPDDAAIGPAPSLPERETGAGSPEANAALSQLRRRVMTEVGKNLLVPLRSWGRLRRNVRRLVPIERPEGDSAPGGEPAAPAAPAPGASGSAGLFGIR